MNLEKKKRVDETLGYFMLLFFSSIAGLFRSKPQNSPVKTILITKYQGLGSLALAKPSIRQVRNLYPEAKLIFLGTPSVVELAQRMPEFDQILVLDDRNLWSSAWSLIGLIFKLRKLKVDWSFDLEVYSSLAAVISLLSFSRNRVGFIVSANPRRKKIYSHLLVFNRFDYLGRAYWRLFGVINPQAFATEKLIDYGPWKLQPRSDSLALPKEYVVVNIHAGELSRERKWPKEYYERWVSSVLKDSPETHIILIGFHKNEIQAVNSFEDHPRLHKWAGRLTLDDLIYTLDLANLVVSNDTAALHLAHSGRAPVVGIFGPTWRLNYFPSGRPQSYALQIPIYCSPCVHHWSPPPCQGDNQCMKQISWQTLFELTAPILGMKNLNLKNSGDVAWSALPEQIASTPHYPGLYRRPSERATITSL
jgi:ADP-heptose:LPS heptosyltransferase